MILSLPYYLLFPLVFLLASSASLPPPAINLLQFLHSLPKSSQLLLLLPWNQSISHCQWQGVSCYPNNSFHVKSLNLSGFGLSGILNNNSVFHLCSHTRIRSLDLSGNNFTGSIPTLLGTCGQLRTILLNDNGFHGPIPPELFQSNRLLKLDLGYNMLSGQIPAEVSLCTELEYIGFYNNFLNGKIPKMIFSLPNLKFLYLNTNNLTGNLPDFSNSCPLYDLWIHENSFSGSLPRTLGNCHNLTMFIASDNSFEGIIQPEIFKHLLQLEVLYLDGNNLEGGIPETLWGLGNLQELVLSGNKLNGSISEQIGRCSRLTDIALSSNALAGQIPHSIGRLKDLNNLFLFDNLLDGSLPVELGNCTSLIELRLQNNFIGGTIPPDICNIESLEVLFLFNNRIGGHIPKQIGIMSSLVQLGLYDNSLIGTIPSEITHLEKLTFLSLAHNNLTGEVPFDLGRNNKPGLVKLDLTGNRLYGLIHTGLFASNSLSVLALGNNLFNGTFPTEIGKCSSLRRVIFSNNLLQGDIPANLDKNAGISFLEVRGNLLTGRIPSVFGYWSNLSMLDFSNNMLSGSIPRELGNLLNLQILRLSSNGLTGSIPSELGHCRKMITLDIGRNSLSGTIPIEIVSSVQLQSLSLEDNKLNGVLPDSFSSLQSLLELQLGNNLLEGPIPCSLSTLHHFSSVLNLSYNRLSGEIPKCLENLDKLQILDLSSNSFAGEIPSQLNNMISLSFVNISLNDLSGRLPAAWIKLMTSTPDSFFGNPKLCVIGNESNICEKARHSHARGLKLAAEVSGAIVSAGLLCVVIYVLVVQVLKKQFFTDQSLLHDYPSKNEDLPEDMQFEDIMRATEGWSEKYVIGRGKHGTVYQTQSLNSRKQWAIKKVELSETSFKLEMRTMSMIKHRNVVKMAGYSIKDGYGFFLTEYMPGGTLFDVLHRSQPRLVLSWDTHFQIALGIAQGLAYLHHDCVPKIIHRDVKSDNILMDSEMEPKVGDFGLAKLVCDSDSSSSTGSVIVGTLGYIAPENGYSTRLTEKCDVYSYGVILLELLCRKMPVDPCFEEGLDIVSWTRKNLEENIDWYCFLDEEISFWETDEQWKALRLLDLALQCTEFTAGSRPSMRDVVGSLVKLNHKYETSVNNSENSSS